MLNGDIEFFHRLQIQEVFYVQFHYCDTLNLPQGYFVGDYVNYGDTIVLEQLNGTILKRINLIQQK